MDIYEKHNTAFKNVSAFTIGSKGERVGSIAFKRGASITCFLHIFGTTMTYGRAGGGGYDRHSAAAYDAACKLENSNSPHIPAIQKALKEGSGAGSWDGELRRAGFDVWQAV